MTKGRWGMDKPQTILEDGAEVKEGKGSSKHAETKPKRNREKSDAVGCSASRIANAVAFSVAF